MRFNWTCEQRSLSPALTASVFEFVIGWWLQPGVGAATPCVSSGGSLLLPLFDNVTADGSVKEVAPALLPADAVLTFSLQVSVGAGSAIPTHLRTAMSSQSVSFQALPKVPEVCTPRLSTCFVVSLCLVCRLICGVCGTRPRSQCCRQMWLLLPHLVNWLPQSRASRRTRWWQTGNLLTGLLPHHSCQTTSLVPVPLRLRCFPLPTRLSSPQHRHHSRFR